MRSDVLLHLGGFIYQSKLFPDTCDPRYIELIKQAFVYPFPYRLFVPGDNDLLPTLENPMASKCWSKLAKLDSPFDKLEYESGARPNFEGTKK